MNHVLIGDCRTMLQRLIDDGVKVQMCVTSPPYWGLRDYGVDGQLGLEPTPEAYVANMVEVFRLIREVLKDDGTLWLNLGSSYAGSWGDSGHRPERDGIAGTQREKNTEFFGREGHPRDAKPVTVSPTGFKPKDLVPIPWMVAMALQADGWYLRSDIIWHKPNPMPESVTDRPTKAHEYVFLLTKSARYFYDAEAIKEPLSIATQEDPRMGKERFEHNGKTLQREKETNGKEMCASFWYANEKGRNARTVWTIPTAPYSGAHFATFPPGLIIPCIKAGSREGDIVLDPFFGSGTTGEVCNRLGRKYIGIELNEAYRPLWERRAQQESIL
jgi:DNA modification methylase